MLRHCREVLVVDDGSRDGTAEILAARGDIHVVTHAENRGYGAALQSAFDFALRNAYDVLVTIDCDGQHQPCMIPQFVARGRGRADIVSGSRYLKKFPGRQPSAGRAAADQPTHYPACEPPLGLCLTDAFCGFKAYRVPILGKFSLTEMGYAMPLELWVQAVALGLKIIEMPVPLIYLDEARSFGGALDHGQTRLKVYEEVLDRAMAAAGIVPKDDVSEDSCGRRSVAGLRVLFLIKRAYDHCPGTSPSAAFGDAAREPRGAGRAAHGRGRGPGGGKRPPSQHRRLLAARPLAGGSLAAGPGGTSRRGPDLDRRLSRRRSAEPRSAGPDLSRRAPAGIVSSRSMVQELRPGRGGPAARRGGREPGDRQRHDEEHSAADARRIARRSTPRSGPLRPARRRLPFEERRILDAKVFASFGRRVAQRIAPLVPDPLIDRFWPMVLDRARHVDRLGYCLAQARHQLEGQWGSQTLEIPQSAVCGSEPFHWFLVHLFANLDRFRDCYNQAVQEYRRANHIRNAAHPVPDLAAEGPWLEAPLWIWTAEQPQRRRVFVCRRGREILVSDRAGQELRLPLTPDGDASDAVERLMAWSRQGVKIRSRALITTLWARLALSDLFLHGIGGAKYDQVTDRLIETFFGLAPPGIMVLSATLYLAGSRGRRRATEDLRDIRRELRELSYHPEKYLRASHFGDGQRPLAGPWSTRSSVDPRTRHAGKCLHALAMPFVASTTNCSRGSPRSGSNYWNSKRKRNGRCGTRRCWARANMASACIPNPI